MFKVYDKDGKVYDVAFEIDVKEWVTAGYTTEEPKKRTSKTTTEVE